MTAMRGVALGLSMRRSNDDFLPYLAEIRCLETSIGQKAYSKAGRCASEVHVSRHCSLSIGFAWLLRYHFNLSGASSS
jgi:hypothetical protein